MAHVSDCPPQILSLVQFLAFNSLSLFLNSTSCEEMSNSHMMATVEMYRSDMGKSVINLLNLPREIRDRIYELVLVSHTGRIYMSPTLPRGSKNGRSVCFTDDDDGNLASPRVTLSLLRTCRQIYVEACEIPYQQNVFVAAEQLNLSTLAKDMENFSLPLIQRLEIVHCAAPNALRVSSIIRRFMKILIEMALDADFKELTLIDSLLGHTHLMARGTSLMVRSNSAAMREIWAEVYLPPGTFKTRMKFVVSTEVAIGRHRYLEMLRAFDIPETTIHDFLKDVHFCSGCDLFFEDNLLWRNFQKVKDFKLEMIENGNPSKATDVTYSIPSRNMNSETLGL